ncbi:MAG: BREX system P-loop protein BrxC, partial [Clostridium sp.]
MNIKLKSIFQKKIDREIKGVVKAGDSNEENLKRELEEFVITDEVKKHLDKFFEAYRKGIDGSTDKNAVWISGFFGSGKSHFLKILSCVLKNEDISGKKVLAYFKGKGLKKSTIDNIKAAEKTKADVILFNIAAKVEGAKEQEAVMGVFNRAFNEMKGLCGSKPWIAALEEKLIEEKAYEAFKSYFRDFSGKCWEEGRENFYFEKDSVIKALMGSTDISETSARTWCEKCEEDFKLNVETFAAKVRDYCENKGENHHVVFLVDEIGQYMGKDTKMLLNLQTVVEELAVKCKGKCWVIVTAQEELTSFADENNKDFSKILGRFNTKIALSSTNADEVIKGRLLKKNKKSAAYLKEFYEENEANIKNLIIFPKESLLKGYRDINDFEESYPFVSYQFNMLQRLLNNIRRSGAAGKDISKGERTLLEACQNAAIDFMNEEIGTVIPLYGFYGVIESYLNPSIKEVIAEAEMNKEINAFDLNVLKTLFLIKYENTLEADSDNIVSL